MRLKRVFAVLCGFAATVAVSASAADCAGLKNLKLAGTVITAAEQVTSATVQPPRSEPLAGLPAFCRVQGIFRPSADSDIHFEIWLPDQWNGRYLGAGNGGFAGAIEYRELAAYLKRGFAVAGSDTGHKGAGTDATWAFHHPEKVKDFGWRAVHLTAIAAKQILQSYYGKPQQKAYFDSCSDGGREALMEAQRFPDDYDGILAGAPAYAWSTLLAAGIPAMQALGNPDAYISSWKLPAIQKAALAACDSLDGVQDGVIDDPSKCHFHPETLLCHGEETFDCVTQPQIDTLKTLYRGATDAQGRIFAPGFSMGDETAWGDWITGEDPESSVFTRFVRNNFRYIVTGDAKWNGLTADPAAMLALSRRKTAADLDATNPDLSAFAAHGGKLILYHGWNDPAISPQFTIDYYNQVQKTMGAAKAEAGVRLYMIPGMQHCLGGPGASAFGQFGTETSRGPKYGLFDSLESWVEHGQLIPTVYATRYEQDGNGSLKPERTRPLCAYPAVPKYKGSGDTSDGANFACANP